MNPLCLRAFVATMKITEKLATKLHEGTRKKRVQYYNF